MPVSYCPTILIAGVANGHQTHKVKTASQMHVAPRIVVHFCPFLSIVATDVTPDMPHTITQTCPRLCPRHAPDDAPDMPQMMPQTCLDDAPDMPRMMPIRILSKSHV